MAKIRSNEGRKYDFLGFWNLATNYSFLISWNFLRSLGFICDRTSERSRRAPWKFYKTSKFKNTDFVPEMTKKLSNEGLDGDFYDFTVWLRIIHLRFLKMFKKSQIFFRRLPSQEVINMNERVGDKRKDTEHGSTFVMVKYKPVFLTKMLIRNEMATIWQSLFFWAKDFISCC